MNDISGTSVSTGLMKDLATGTRLTSEHEDMTVSTRLNTAAQGSFPYQSTTVDNSSVDVSHVNIGTTVGGDNILMSDKNVTFSSTSTNITKAFNSQPTDMANIFSSEPATYLGTFYSTESTVRSTSFMNDIASSNHTNSTTPWTPSLNDSDNFLNITAEDYLQQLNTDFAELLFPAIVVLSLLMVLGAVGNVFVLHVYTWRMKGGTITRFIQALAVFDLLSCCVAIPGEIIDMSNNYTFGRDPFCKAVRTVNLFCTVSSGWTLIVVAIDRYKRICCPLRRQIAPKGAVLIVFICTVASLVISLPTAALYGGRSVVTEYPHVHGSDCSISDRFIGTVFPLAYNGLQMLLFLVGAIILIVLYSLIARRIFHHVYQRQQRRQSVNLGRYRFSPCSPSFGSSPTTTTENAISPDQTTPPATKVASESQSGNTETTFQRNNCTAVPGHNMEANSQRKDNFFHRAFKTEVVRVNKPEETSIIALNGNNNNDSVKSGSVSHETKSTRSIRMIVNELIVPPQPQMSIHKSEAENGAVENGTALVPQPDSGDKTNKTSCAQLSHSYETVSDASNAGLYFTFNNTSGSGRDVGKLRNTKDMITAHSSNTLLVRRMQKTKEMNDPRWKRHSFTLGSLPIPLRPQRRVLFPASVECKDKRKSPKRRRKTENDDLDSDNAYRDEEDNASYIPRRRVSSIRGFKDLKNLAKRSESSSTRRTTLMLFLITLVYVLSFLPHLILMTIKSQDENSLSGYGGSWEVALNLLIRSYFINSVANPIIYSFFSKNFFRECKNSLRCRR